MSDTRKVKVRYSATFETVLELPIHASKDDCEDAISNIDIPENNKNQYVPDSFKTLAVTDEDDKPFLVQL